MKRKILLLMCAILLAVAGCTGGGASDLYETASFEEMQNNKEHAAQLYEEIIRKYPGTEYAEKSQKRLAQLKGK